MNHPALRGVMAFEVRPWHIFVPWAGRKLLAGGHNLPDMFEVIRVICLDA
jgi:hypothetical protein